MDKLSREKLVLGLERAGKGLKKKLGKGFEVSMIPAVADELLRLQDKKGVDLKSANIPSLRKDLEVDQDKDSLLGVSLSVLEIFQTSGRGCKKPSQVQSPLPETADLPKMKSWMKPLKPKAKVLERFKEKYKELNNAICKDMGRSHKLKVFTTDEILQEFGESDVFELGGGVHGSCFLVQDKNWVVKMMARNYDGVRTGTIELESLLWLQHFKGVQKLVGIWPEQMAIISENAGPTVQRCVESGQLNGRDKRKIVLSLAMAVRSILRYRRVHNDLHKKNVCVQRDEQGELQAVLIDFGRATNRGVTEMNLRSDYEDTSHLAPETFLYTKQTAITEAYSLGYLIRYIFGQDVPEDMSQWVKRAMGAPEGRPTVQELITALTEGETQGN